MNTRSSLSKPPNISRLCFCAALIAVTPVAAQNQRYYPQQAPTYSQQPQYSQPPPGYGASAYGYPQQQTHYENPLQFLPKFGKRMGDMVRRLFYGKNSTGWNQPPQGYAQGGGYSLDSRQHQSATPNYPQQPGYQYPQQQSPAQPHYNYPPQQKQPISPAHPQPTSKTVAKTPPSSSRSGKTRSTRTYTPPKAASKSPANKKTSSSAVASTPPAPKQPDPQPPANTTTRRSESTPPRETVTASNNSSNFLKGRKTSKAGRVVSPYPPYKELDVTGLDSGSLALDPTTQKVFEVP